ncbi:hypothetical protein DNC80_07730 [Flavobacterium sp. SOK18b]|uniref:hypothetical protein n=1 Tax=Flavobacterium sp. SOK18b TaxID=797900 RepID=UPI0015F9C3EA|nr:hypothetical protein [Flavobacterium sp. SOK18b]MBB1193558.1 hypothetical protein [Flavobacterium sp. SOK18b]
MTLETEQNIKIAAGVAGGLLLLSLIIRKKTESSDDPTGNGNSIPTQFVFNAKNVANGLYQAMKDSGTEEEAILEVLKTVTQSQFAQVVTAFGSLPYNATTGNQYSFNPFSPLPKVNLKGWLIEELSLKDYTILRNKYPYHL